MYEGIEYLCQDFKKLEEYVSPREQKKNKRNIPDGDTKLDKIMAINWTDKGAEKSELVLLQ